ncbi:MAG TPA: hemolysin III family protein [Spirochaetota bacterium]|jgi:hemolysin III|nr:hemolysin III family protein [Spirochaetota bacterium]HPJ14548.1 hemolysin III family protein [Spirochaetota bacterium]HPM33914.1 hemolysin III family protein [Spirochaetota bacterium]HPW51721.1 hemolysin III family protein [Spirochaetota bacterium]
MKKSETVSFATHFGAALLSFAGTIFLAAYSKTPELKAVSLIYGFAITFLFTSSAVYHATKKSENSVSIFRKLDHFAIFVMIAGSYTPICYLFLDGAWMISILSVQWSLVIAGGIIKFFVTGKSRILSTSIYLIMGWILLIPLKKLLSTIPSSQLFFLLGEGFAFTTGAIFYMIKKPARVFHEIFHVFCIIGAALHYTAVFLSIV